MERIISVTDLIRNASRIAEEVETEGTVYRITRNGRGSMVLVDNEYFEGWMHVIDEMRQPGWREGLAEARRDAAAGRTFSLDDVAKELGLEGSPRRTRKGTTSRAAGRRRKTRR